MANAKQNLKQLDEQILIKMKERQLKAMAQEDNRAQSITIGNAGGGVTEITMRGTTGGSLWNVYQPVEVVELINQLAANIGCHIHIHPREDFSSWRQWKEISDEEKERLKGFPPFSEHMESGFRLGTGSPVLPSQKNQGRVEFKECVKLKVQENEDAVATKKAVNKRTPKRSRATTK